MKHFWKMLTIVLNVVPNPVGRLLNLFRREPAVETSSYTTTEGETVPMRIYHPEKLKNAPALILYPGITPAAEEHEAVNVLARATALAGIRTFLPRIPAMKEVLVREESIEHMINVYETVEIREDIDIERIACVGMSFGGSLFVKACLDERLKNRPASVISYGSYFDFKEALQFAITGRCSDGKNEYVFEPHNWGRIVFFHNYLEYLDNPCNPENIRAYLLDQVANDGENGDELYAAFPEEDRILIDKIVSDQSKEAVEMVQQVMDKIENILLPLSPIQFLDEIDFPLYLMHGASDTMIPFTETVRFGRALEERGKEVHTFISTLYAHSEIEGYGKGPLGLISELWRMGRFMQNMLRPVL
ncbi:MAG: hypothetical protein QF771_04340 [Candidatus Marinimicrobia bacterium]|nr:hypothetical protein [Candidatus Neomarinimicrobiota bacterium]